MPSTPVSLDSPDREISQESFEIDSAALLGRMRKGLPQIIGLALLGTVAGAIGYLLITKDQPQVTSTRISFAFPGFERGEYPDHSKFQPDDIRAPSIVLDALKREGLDTSASFQSSLRAGIGVEGIISPNVVKERDRIRATGQIPPPYIPDEYYVTLAAPKSAQLSTRARANLLRDMVELYKENFQRTYGDIPLAFGNAFTTLRNADFPEYELILNREVQNVSAYLTQQLDQAKTFRSPTTNLSFQELIEQTDLFAQIRLNETLGVIRETGLSRDRRMALTKMNYNVRVLEDQETLAVEENKVVSDLLAQTQQRGQNYVLATKSQTAPARGDAPVLDQGLIESLLANDSYNFLVHRALEAGMKLKQIQTEKAQLIAMRDNLKSFTGGVSIDQVPAAAQVRQSLALLEQEYQELIARIRKTHADFARQQYGDAVRLTDAVTTEGILRPIGVAMAFGCMLGFAAGSGLSLLGYYSTLKSD